jgi:hypothetical protein
VDNLPYLWQAHLFPIKEKNMSNVTKLPLKKTAIVWEWHIGGEGENASHTYGECSTLKEAIQTILFEYDARPVGENLHIWITKNDGSPHPLEAVWGQHRDMSRNVWEPRMVAFFKRRLG